MGQFQKAQTRVEKCYCFKYNRNNFLIHDYFFAKSIDKVRNGGVIAFVTSSGTMDKNLISESSATIWVGGQLVLAALVPALRKINPDLPRIVAKKFNKLAWGAYALLIVSGIWNMVSIPKDAPSNYSMVLGFKMAIVLLSGVAALLHSNAKEPKKIAMWGSISGLTALAALYLGVLLAG